MASHMKPEWCQCQHRCHELSLVTTPGTRNIEWWQKELCQRDIYNLSVDAKIVYLPMLSRDVTPEEQDYNVYLAETACSPRPLFRAWCSVERSPKTSNSKEVVDDSDALVTALRRRYGNLKVVGADLDRMFAGTPVEEIFRSGRWAHNTRESSVPEMCFGP
ncbi:uncharacterized protein LOC122261207 [Penaeus japonicus]|uniref:uncharacterized protein LOC122261207 n=1 Tax=Penaeus japonicus TaxID=27405 RepID=UPI001C7143B7|nr:uncharacterized protein LOC122261207 [Penaeus japonicus]